MQNNKHPFLSDSACIHRLVSEYKKHGSLVVAYDFDNLVYDFHQRGHDYSEVIDLLRKAKAVGCHLIIFTAANNLNHVKEFCSYNEIPYDGVNEDPPFFKNHSSRKIYYNILLDDRAGLSAAFTHLQETINIIKNKI